MDSTACEDCGARENTPERRGHARPPTGARAMWDDLEWYLTAMCVFAVIGFLVVLGGAAWVLWRVLDAVL